MQYTTLGRTGLKVSVAGLGTGGFSRLGLNNGGTEDEAIAVVRAAHELGVTLFDTGTNYQNVAVLGRALQPIKREAVVITSKSPIHNGKANRPVAEIVGLLDETLRDLKTDYLDVFQLHGPPPSFYGFAVDEVIPALLKEREKGKFRFLGISETAPGDVQHTVIARAVQAGLIDVCMVAFHMMHQTARTTLFPLTQTAGVGTMLMYAVRGIFTRPERLAPEVRALVEAGQLPAEMAGQDNVLDFLIHAGGGSSLPDAAYRYVRHEPGVDIVLFGTGSRAHLAENVASLLKPALPAADKAKVDALFGHLVGVGLDRPAHAPPLVP
jgi:L-galactose dehydrogenase